jgi:hypothetical protein
MKLFTSQHNVNKTELLNLQQNRCQKSRSRKYELSIMSSVYVPVFVMKLAIEVSMRAV